MKIKKGDTVKILAGKDRGKTGKIIKIDLNEETVTVEGFNLYKKHVRPRREGEKGQVILVCPTCHKSVRAGYRFENEKKFRYCRKCNSKI